MNKWNKREKKVQNVKIHESTASRVKSPESTVCRYMRSTMSNTGGGGDPCMASTLDDGGVVEKIKLLDDLSKSQGLCGENVDGEVQVRCQVRCDVKNSDNTNCAECSAKYMIQDGHLSDPKTIVAWLCVKKQFEVKSSVSSTGMKKKSTVHLHCLEEKEVQGDHSDLKSAKGEFIKLKLGYLGLAEKGKTMGKSYALESKLILLPAGTSAGPTRDQGLGGQFRPQGLDQWRGGGLGTWGEAGPAEKRSTEEN